MKKMTLLASVILSSVVSSAAFAQLAPIGQVKQYPYMRMILGSNPLAWKVNKTTWSAADEASFGKFVQRIGYAVEKHKCNTFDSCMTNPAVNPYVTSDPDGIRYFADCADVPYWLRTYFAFKNHLPMTLTVNTAPRDPNDPKADNRNETINGNMVSVRADSVGSNGKFPDITQFLSSPTSHGFILDSISSGTYRMPVIPTDGEPLQDFYPIAIKRGSIRLGTTIYTADGHVAIVYKIEDDGNIGTLNGHPADNAASQSPLAVRDYNDLFKRSRQEHGSIFKNFRPLDLVGAQADAEGNLVGGKIVLRSDSQIADRSLEQAKLHFNSSAEYFMFVRKRMAAGALKMDVMTEFNRSLTNICETVQGRVELVNQAIAAGMDAKQIDSLPANIVSASGDWENYSTPSRDINIRVLFKEALDNLKTNVRGYRAGNKMYSYAGHNLAQDLYNAYRQTAQACTITYTSRTGVTKTLDLEQVRNRMFKISFDPYQCADLRWGDDAAGGQACGEDMRWYNAEQYLRNMTSKDALGNTGMTVDQLEATNQQQNKPFEWNTNIIGYIQAVANATGVKLN